MSTEHIAKSIDQVIQHYVAHPDEVRGADKSATAVLETGMRFRVDAPSGDPVFSDMASALGGGASAPSPGWLMRAALAACDASTIVMRAAQLGVTLSRLEVTAESISDDRGLLGMDDAVPAGPLSVRTVVRIRADGVAPEKLEEIVAWAEAHSPVGDAVRRQVPCTTSVEIV